MIYVRIFDIRSQIRALDPLLLLDKILNMIQQKENHKKLMINWDIKQESATTFTTRTSIELRCRKEKNLLKCIVENVAMAMLDVSSWSGIDLAGAYEVIMEGLAEDEEAKVED